MSIKHYLSIIVIVMAGTQLRGQVNAAVLFNNLGAKAVVGYAFNRVLTLDAGVYSAADLEDISPEFTLRGHFLHRPHYRAYLGAGVATNMLYSLVFPLGVDAAPFAQARELGLRFEIILMAGLDGNPNLVLPTFGLTYNLGK